MKFDKSLADFFTRSPSHSVRYLVASFLVALPIASLSPASNAAILLNSNVIYTVGGVVQAQDPQAGVVPGTVVVNSQVNTPFNTFTHDFAADPGVGQAALNALGISGTKADAAFATGGPDRNTLTATTTYTQTETNNTAVALDYDMLILLKGPKLRLSDFGGCCFGGPDDPFANPASNNIGARVNYTVEVDGIPIFIADAKFFGGRIGGRILDKSGSQDGLAPDGSTVSADLGGTAVIDPVFPASIFGFDFNDIFGVLDIGTFAAGANPGRPGTRSRCRYLEKRR